MDDSSPRHSKLDFTKYSKHGLQSYAGIFWTGLVAAAAAIWVIPPFSFVFGTGTFVVVFTIIHTFLFLLLFRRVLLRPFYGKQPNESEAVLMEYFGQPDDKQEAFSTELIENALHLREVFAQDCMAAKADIVFFPANNPLSQLRQLFADTQLSRIIVTEGNDLEKILGYVHVQQMFDEPQRLRDLILPIAFVPATMPANELLNRFVRTRTNIACVRAEDGALAGLVTLENALEQLFGAIEDEHD